MSSLWSLALIICYCCFSRFVYDVWTSFQNRIPVRGDPHILIVGDPGLGKSQMLQAIANVAPRAVYVCANTTSTSGLTVSSVCHWKFFLIFCADDRSFSCFSVLFLVYLLLIKHCWCLGLLYCMMWSSLRTLFVLFMAFFIQNYNDIISTLPMPLSLTFQKVDRTVVETLQR